MSVVATMCSLSVVLAALLFGAFLWLTWERRCPRCGGKEWIPLPHLGPFVRYCRRCSYAEDAATGRRA